MENTTKQQEIKALTELCNNDTYFAEFFAKDLDKMIENIKNDFPIELGTSFNQKAEKLEIAKEKAIKSLCETMLCVEAYGKTDGKLQERVIEELGQHETIKYKYSLGIPLNNKDIEYLINKI